MYVDPRKCAELRGVCISYSNNMCDCVVSDYPLNVRQIDYRNRVLTLEISADFNKLCSISGDGLEGNFSHGPLAWEFTREIDYKSYIDNFVVSAYSNVDRGFYLIVSVLENNQWVEKYNAEKYGYYSTAHEVALLASPVGKIRITTKGKFGDLGNYGKYSISTNCRQLQLVVEAVDAFRGVTYTRADVSLSRSESRKTIALSPVPGGAIEVVVREARLGTLRTTVLNLPQESTLPQELEITKAIVNTGREVVEAKHGETVRVHTTDVRMSIVIRSPVTASGAVYLNGSLVGYVNLVVGETSYELVYKKLSAGKDTVKINVEGGGRRSNVFIIDLEGGVSCPSECVPLDSCRGVVVGRCDGDRVCCDYSKKPIIHITEYKQHITTASPDVDVTFRVANRGEGGCVPEVSLFLDGITGKWTGSYTLNPNNYVDGRIGVRLPREGTFRGKLCSVCRGETQCHHSVDVTIDYFTSPTIKLTKEPTAVWVNENTVDIEVCFSAPRGSSVTISANAGGVGESKTVVVQQDPMCEKLRLSPITFETTANVEVCQNNKCVSTSVRITRPRNWISIVSINHRAQTCTSSSSSVLVTLEIVVTGDWHGTMVISYLPRNATSPIKLVEKNIAVNKLYTAIENVNLPCTESTIIVEFIRNNTVEARRTIDFKPTIVKPNPNCSNCIPRECCRQCEPNTDNCNGMRNHCCCRDPIQNCICDNCVDKSLCKRCSADCGENKCCCVETWEKCYADLDVKVDGSQVIIIPRNFRGEVNISVVRTNDNKQASVRKSNGYYVADLEPGTWEIRARDDKGCYASKNVEIKQTSPIQTPTPTPTPTPISIEEFMPLLFMALIIALAVRAIE